VRVAILDDEKGSVQNLTLLLAEHCLEADIVYKETSSTRALHEITKYQVDLLFLDVQMPGLNGFEFLNELGTYAFEVVFVTAFDTYALRALKIAALDYLLKPIDVGELKDAVKKAGNRKMDLRHQLSLLQDHLGSNPIDQKIALPDSEGIELVKISEIIYCKSDSNYTWFYMTGGRSKLISNTLKDYERILKPYNFIRAHQSYLVNKSFIRLINNSGLVLDVENIVEIPVAQSRRKSVLKQIR